MLITDSETSAAEEAVSEGESERAAEVCDEAPVAARGRAAVDDEGYSDIEVCLTSSDDEDME